MAGSHCFFSCANGTHEITVESFKFLCKNGRKGRIIIEQGELCVETRHSSICIVRVKMCVKCFLVFWNLKRVLTVKNSATGSKEIRRGCAKQHAHVCVHVKTSVIRGEMILKRFHPRSADVHEDVGSAMHGIQSAGAPVARPREWSVRMDVFMNVGETKFLKQLIGTAATRLRHVIIEVAHDNDVMIGLKQTLQEAAKILLESGPRGCMRCSRGGSSCDAGLLSVCGFGSSRASVNRLTDLQDCHMS